MRYAPGAMVEILRCPACGAADTSPLGPDGAHRCVFCGVKYVVKSGRAEAERGAPAPRRDADASRPSGGRKVAAVALGVVLVGIGIGALVAGRTDGPAAPDAAGAPSGGRADPVVVAPATVETSAPAPEPAPTATFVEHGVRPGSEGAYWVLGVVTNTSPYPLENPRFDIVFLDGEGREVGSDFAFAHGNPLAAGESLPVALLANDAPPHVAHRVEVRPERLTWDLRMAEGLVAEPFEPVQDRWGDWQTSGKVRNTGSEAAKFVQVIVSAWDAEGKLLGVDGTYAVGEEGLPAGGEARYAQRVDTLDRPPARFSVLVYGRR